MPMETSMLGNGAMGTGMDMELIPITMEMYTKALGRMTKSKVKEL